MKTEEDPQKEAEDAFNAAHAGFWLFGSPLNSYSLSRKVAAQAMGMIYPFVGEAGQRQMEETNTYPGALKDTIILLWLCSLPDSSDLSKEALRAGEWTPNRACGKPEQALDLAMQWAESVGVDSLHSEKGSEAYQVFMAIVAGVSASEFMLASSKGSAGGDTEDPKTTRDEPQSANTLKPSTRKQGTTKHTSAKNSLTV